MHVSLSIFQITRAKVKVTTMLVQNNIPLALADEPSAKDICLLQNQNPSTVKHPDIVGLHTWKIKNIDRLLDDIKALQDDQMNEYQVEFTVYIDLSTPEVLTTNFVTTWIVE